MESRQQEAVCHQNPWNTTKTKEDDEADADSPWDRVQSVLKEVKELRNDVENVLKLQEDSKLPPAYG